MHLIQRINYAALTALGIGYAIWGYASYPTDAEIFEKKSRHPAYKQQYDATEAFSALENAANALNPSPIHVSESATSNPLGALLYGIAQMAEDPVPQPLKARRILENAEVGTYSDSFRTLASAIKQQDPAIDTQFKTIREKIRSDQHNAYLATEELVREQEHKQRDSWLFAIIGIGISLVTLGAWYANSTISFRSPARKN